VILVVAFEYYKNNLNKIYLKYFLSNTSLIVLINLYVFVFIFSSTSLLLLKNSNPINNGELTVCYTSIFTFISLVPMTFYCSYFLVKNLSVNDIIDEYMKKLSFDKIFLLNSENKIFPCIEDEEKSIPIAKVVDQDCLLIIYKLLINQLSTENLVKAQIILKDISDSFNKFILGKEEIEIEHSTNFHQYRFAHFLTNLINETKENPKLYNVIVFEKVLEASNRLYIEYNKKKYDISYLEPFREAFFSKLFETYRGNGEMIKKILDTITRAYLKTQG